MDIVFKSCMLFLFLEETFPRVNTNSRVKIHIVTDTNSTNSFIYVHNNFTNKDILFMCRSDIKKVLQCIDIFYKRSSAIRVFMLKLNAFFYRFILLIVDS